MNSTTGGTKRSLIGHVISDRSDKTRVIRVETLVKDPLMGKYIRRRKKVMAHDPQNETRIGDRVQIVESRPLSRRKRWHLVKVLEKAV